MTSHKTETPQPPEPRNRSNPPAPPKQSHRNRHKLVKPPSSSAPVFNPKTKKQSLKTQPRVSRDEAEMEPSCCNGEIQVETKSKDTHRETRPGSRREGGGHEWEKGGGRGNSRFLLFRPDVPLSFLGVFHSVWSNRGAVGNATTSFRLQMGRPVSKLKSFDSDTLICSGCSK